jgi:hypothetical protein
MPLTEAQTIDRIGEIREQRRNLRAEELNLLKTLQLPIAKNGTGYMGYGRKTLWVKGTMYQAGKRIYDYTGGRWHRKGLILTERINATD